MLLHFRNVSTYLQVAVLLGQSTQEILYCLQATLTENLARQSVIRPLRHGHVVKQLRTPVVLQLDGHQRD